MAAIQSLPAEQAAEKLKIVSEWIEMSLPLALTRAGLLFYDDEMHLCLSPVMLRWQRYLYQSEGLQLWQAHGKAS